MRDEQALARWQILAHYRALVWPIVQHYLGDPQYPGAFQIPDRYRRERDLHWSTVAEYPLRQGKYLRAALLMLTCAAMGGEETQGYDFVALVSIRAGQEITWNYETTEYALLAVERCLCGSATCRGRTRGFRYLSPEERERFGPYIADYLKAAGQVDCTTRLVTPGEEDL
jgi:hypothetical protein